MEMVTKENGLKHLYFLHVYTAINTYLIHTVYVQYVSSLTQADWEETSEKVHAWIQTQDLVMTEPN